MESSRLVAVVSALGQPTRLRIVELLSDVGDEGLSAGDLVAAVGIPKNTMSGHLGILANSGLVSSRRSGRNIHYRLEADVIGAVIEHLQGLMR